MVRKYVQPKKKRNHPPVQVPAGGSSAAESELSVVYAAETKTGSAPVAAADAVKYESLPQELRRITFLTVLTIAIMVGLWFILR